MSGPGRPKIKLSMPLLLLDLVGSMVLGLGLLEYFGRKGLVIPESYQFPYYAPLMIVVGFLLTLPFLLDLIKQTSRRHTGYSGPSQPSYRRRR